MLQLSPARKNKINLADYNCAQDIQNRILMSDFTPTDLEVLEEILFSSIKISYRKLQRSLDMDEAVLGPILHRFSQAGLLAFEGDAITVDKEMRKYFEFQIQRFDAEFKPDMEFAQALLRKVPIHVLPTWYSLPRSSNNIFESIVEKYLLSPQMYQRYLQDLNFGDAKIQGILDDVLSSPEQKIHSSDLIAKYNLTRAEFEEIMLLLEFNFALCISYQKEDDHWLEVATPFHEWAQYLQFLKKTDTPLLPRSAKIIKKRENDYAFLEDAAAFLAAAKKKGFSVDGPRPAELMDVTEDYYKHLIEKLRIVRLIEEADGKVQLLPNAAEFLEMNYESKALYLYRHPFNRLLSTPHLGKVANDRNIREAEKSVRRVLRGGWVFLDDFLKGVIVPLSENSVISLKKTGKQWRYTLPVYSDEEKELICATIKEWLFETGIVSVGVCDGRDCFAVTSFGRFFFEE